MGEVTFTAYLKPEPQGSIRAFQPRGLSRPVLTSDNEKLKPFRHQMTMLARLAVRDAGLPDEPMAKKHLPVSVHLEFTFRRPSGCPRRRLFPTVKPDIDKLSRACLDAFTGVFYVDDGQVVVAVAYKKYGPVENVFVRVRVMNDVQPTEGSR